MKGESFLFIMRKPHHIERFSSFIQNELAFFLREKMHLNKGILVSLVRVESASSEGRIHAWVSVWPDEERERVAKQLQLLENKAKAHLAGRLNRKYAASVHFYVIGAT